MHKRLRLASLLLWLSLYYGPAWADQAGWVLVESGTRTLTVLSGENKTLDRFDNISVGRGGIAPLHYRGDDTTPRGDYRILAIRPSRRFGTFVALDYPTPDHAGQAADAGRLDPDSFDAIVEAWLARRLPPQDTVLGGAIGIHGVGRGDPAIHRAFDWTDGCVALSNAQLHRFARWVRVGMRVVIR
ncbi:L,D-transpeptidase family protein [Crenobacter cavernae]|uniref:Murein L,D-transpeptidase n=1 Tax=Crenobacter cavernae TaxID=2290923 RepID=A0A345YA54_9NEIS|nr:L,D-transpeptidase [Crenobacter cavernae]AXK40806.1 murein L,D-transpeptidase [Crenobacter cavernae]